MTSLPSSEQSLAAELDYRTPRAFIPSVKMIDAVAAIAKPKETRRLRGHAIEKKKSEKAIQVATLIQLSGVDSTIASQMVIAKLNTATTQIAAKRRRPEFDSNCCNMALFRPGR